VSRVRFDYDARRWLSGDFTLPRINNDFVLLTPKDMLTRDEAWISRSDLLDSFSEIMPAIPNEQLRAQVSDHFNRRLAEDPSKTESREAAASTIEAFPGVLDYYIKHKEDNAADAHRVSNAKVRETEEQFVTQIREMVEQYLAGTDFYRPADSFETSLERIHFLKDVIEKQDGYRIFYLKGKPIKREADLQIMFRLTWRASDYDVNREVNNGRGPVDFKVSNGSGDKTLIEFKLASNGKLKQNLKHQVDAYEAANDTSKSIKAILYFDESEYQKIVSILKDLDIEGRRDIVLIDAEWRESASNISG